MNEINGKISAEVIVEVRIIETENLIKRIEGDMEQPTHTAAMALREMELEVLQDNLNELHIALEWIRSK